MTLIKTFIKRLFCKHQWRETSYFMVQFGMAKMYVSRCDKCGAEKVSQ